MDRVFGDLIEDAGAVIVGRRTYDNSIPEWGGGGQAGVSEDVIRPSSA